MRHSATLRTRSGGRAMGRQASAHGCGSRIVGAELFSGWAAGASCCCGGRLLSGAYTRGDDGKGWPGQGGRRRDWRPNRSEAEGVGTDDRNRPIRRRGRGPAPGEGRSPAAAGRVEDGRQWIYGGEERGGRSSSCAWRRARGGRREGAGRGGRVRG